MIIAAAGCGADGRRGDGENERALDRDAGPDAGDPVQCFACRAVLCCDEFVPPSRCVRQVVAVSCDDPRGEPPDRCVFGDGQSAVCYPAGQDAGPPDELPEGCLPQCPPGYAVSP